MQKDVDTLSITCVSALQLKLDLFFKIKAPIYDGGGGGDNEASANTYL